MTKRDVAGIVGTERDPAAEKCGRRVGADEDGQVGNLEDDHTKLGLAEVLHLLELEEIPLHALQKRDARVCLAVSKHDREAAPPRVCNVNVLVLPLVDVNGFYEQLDGRLAVLVRHRLHAPITSISSIPLRRAVASAKMSVDV